MASATAAPAPVASAFIERRTLGPSALLAIKGGLWGTVVAASQAAGASWLAESRAARASGQAVCGEALKRGFASRATTFFPAIIGTTVAFTVIRGTGDTRGLVGLVQPLAIVSLPTVAYAAYSHAMPPAALTFGLASCVLLHAYDRILKPRGLMQENMPTTHLHRRTM